MDSSYTTSGRDSSNTYSFLAATEDNNAKFRCESSNELSTEPSTAEIVLSVQCKTYLIFRLYLVEVGQAELFRASGCNFMSRSGFGSGRAELKLLESGFGL